MSDTELRDVIDQLANALFLHRNDWWEDAPESVNIRQRTERDAALEAARRIGWLPR